MGSVDLTFVLSILSPLLIGVLGVGIEARARERIDRLILVQSGDLKGWLMAACRGRSNRGDWQRGLVRRRGMVGGAGAAETLTLVALAATLRFGEDCWLRSALRAIG